MEQVFKTQITDMLGIDHPILCGGIIAHIVSTRSGDAELNKSRKEKGTLVASGFIAGGAIMGVVSALLALAVGDSLNTGIGEGIYGEGLSVVLYACLCYYLYRYSKND